MRQPAVYYLTPDNDEPSWGIGLLYHHVRILRELGFDAFVLHFAEPFRLSWLQVEAPVRYLDRGPTFHRDDVLVVPEVLAHHAVDWSGSCRRIVFVQGSFLIGAGSDQAVDYRELGFEAALAAMPHIQEIVARHHGLLPELVPPFVPEYFFVAPGSLQGPRWPEVLLAGKPAYRQAGYLDYDIAAKLIGRHFAELRTSTDADWRLVELRGKTHREVAAAMQRAAFLVNLNTLESFNTTVPEAMAAGCVAICYEAFGGRDFLRPGQNAYVFPNNWIYPLVETLCKLTETLSSRQEELAEVRIAAWETAREYRAERTAEALAAFFRVFLG